ncbi:MAG: hypothetical protein IJW16_03670 [Clostridia bacterium]|nr:hypothetical protein [Clostridia bacterium]
MTWNDFRKQVKSVSGKAADKINQAADIATLQIKLSSTERKLSAAYESLGKIAYKHFTEENDNDVEKVTHAVGAVQAIQLDIKTLKAQIEQLKKQNEEKKASADTDTGKEDASKAEK